MTSQRVLLLLPLLILAALPVAACSYCVAAQIDRSLPPAMAWSIFIIVGYPIVAGLLPHPESTVTSSVLGALAWVFGALLLGAIWMAQLPLFFLFVFFIGHLVRGLRDEPVQQRRAKLLAITLSLLFLTVTVASYAFAHNQTTADYILRWQGSNPARAWLKELETKGDRESLRRVVAEADSFESSCAAKSLATIGEPAIDAPLIVHAMKRSGSDIDPYKSFEAQNFSDALETLLKRKAPGEGKSTDWEAVMPSHNP
ncbi:MAG: hypothetical protein SFY68_02340 [Candidatus Sumerlaeia bacterium]|nr:hypothetical protein [Candidatus Sumerlaeia bacterium]